MVPPRLNSYVMAHLPLPSLRSFRYLTLLLLPSCTTTTETMEAVKELAESVQENSDTITQIISEESVRWREVISTFLEYVKPAVASMIEKVEKFFDSLPSNESVNKTQLKLNNAITTGTWALAAILFMVVVIGGIVIYHNWPSVTRKRHLKFSSKNAPK